MSLRGFVVAGALCATFALGLAQAKAQDNDPRLVTKAYDAARVVKIHGRPGVQATIAFADDEKIENVAVGDSDKWQITPNKRANLLFARPLDPAANTNMTVVTDKRTYLFDLVASAKDQPVYMLRFTYGDQVPALPATPATVANAPPPVLAAPPSEPPAPPPARRAEAMPEPQRLVAPQAAPSPPPASADVLPPSPPAPAYASAVDAVVGAPPEALPADPSDPPAEADRPGDPPPARLERPRRERQARTRRSPEATPAVQQAQPSETAPAAPLAVPPSPLEPGALNFAWTRGGRGALLPMRVYDDGRATYLVWGAKQAVPTVEVSGPDGANVTPLMTRHENSVVIPGVPSRILFSAGKASAWLDNIRASRSRVPLAGRNPGGATE